METHRVEDMHFAITTDRYEATEHFVTEAKMELHKLERIKKQFGLEENSAFLEVLVKNARLELEKQFLSYVDTNAEQLDFDLYKKTNIDRFANFFRANSRVSLKKSHKNRDIAKGTYFLSIIGDLYRENMFIADSAFIIISLNMAQFVGASVEEFTKATQNQTQFLQNFEEYDEDLMHPAGIIELGMSTEGRAYGTVAVVINRELPDNTIYFGTKNPQGLALFYNVNDNAVTTYDTMPEVGKAMTINKVYRLNMYHTFKVIDKIPQFKKIIFNDVN